MLDLQEVYDFPFEFAVYDETVLERAINNLFFMAGVSYYKLYLAPEIVIDKGEMDETHAKFFSEVYQNGLGEFFYVNQLDPRTAITFPVNQTSSPQPIATKSSGLLVGVGGGKDSLVSIEVLRKIRDDITTWVMNHQEKLEPLVQEIGLPNVWVSRQWDPRLPELNTQGAYNGHIPFSAVLACVGTVAAILAGKRDVVVSNEKSADEPTLTYQGVSINHQYSKSSDFERLYQSLLQADFGESIRYYSLLRPLSELRIAELFSKLGFEKYKHVFSSCNRAFTQASRPGIFWCGECPKCAFTFLMLTPFISRGSLEALFGKNLLLDPLPKPQYEQLLGVDGDKPLECVGEIEESRAAMDQAKAIYPELSHYTYETHPDYDYRSIGPDALPADVKPTLSQFEQL